MKLIAGLGNPGKKYENTPHNAGFMVVDRLADDLGCRLKRSIRFKSRMAQSVYEGESLLLVSPLTYMNLSGNAVSRVMRYRKLDLEDLVIVLDDADLEIGRIRIKPAGGSGGHRGLASVISCVGSNEFARIRIGVGRDERGKDLVDHVLSSLSRGDRDKIDDAVSTASKAVLHLVENGVESAMNEFNRTK